MRTKIILFLNSWNLFLTHAVKMKRDKSSKSQPARIMNNQSEEILRNSEIENNCLFSHPWKLPKLNQLRIFKLGAPSFPYKKRIKDEGKNVMHF